ncbi:hypothetical protein QQS21_003069 [Conoideocrella luteorostrata]|uniref:Very-long-chain 3-oxoacyl-CoA synthase n=1 Tax=Conoideocrella luteorostrata TaxID=1105319 RepID=A0AAJ0CX01_9HYPO|nr:hypothetical protein QQS21_003069 [Conoideocrella luteorostrata]
MILFLMILQSCAFVSAWALVHRHVKTNGPISGSRKFTVLNSRFYSAASAALLIFIVTSKHEETAQKLYFASKFYEYIDVLGVRASGGEIDLHFAVHHLTTPYLTYIRAIRYDEGWRIVAALNAFHHILMYAFFGGAGFCRPALPVTGTAQLVAGLIGEAWMIWRKSIDSMGPSWPNGLSLGMLIVYFVLWTRDLRLRAQSQSQSSQSKSS